MSCKPSARKGKAGNLLPLRAERVQADGKASVRDGRTLPMFAFERLPLRKKKLVNRGHKAQNKVRALRQVSNYNSTS